MNIETKEQKEDNKINKNPKNSSDDQKLLSSFDFFEKKQLTAQFGGVGEESSIIQKTINKEDENYIKSFEEKENEESDEKQEIIKNREENINENNGKEIVNDTN